MKRAYVIVQVEVTDPAAYQSYKALTPAAVAAYGGRFIVRGGAMENLEGTWEVPRLVILEFPTMERARQWYDSPEYQAAKAVREGAARMVMTAVEGVE